MVSLFPSFQIKWEITHFIGKGRSFSCKFPMWDCLSQRKKNHKPQNVRSTPVFLVNFQCGIAFHKGKNPKPQNLGSIV